MSTATAEKTSTPAGLDPRTLVRVFEEGFGPGAWHGNDLKAALADVTPALAFWRPAPGRHNIAEIALHHAYTTRSVRSQLSGEPAEPFVLEGEDWFELSGRSNAKRNALGWDEVRAALTAEQEKLAAVIEPRARRAAGGKTDAERFDLVLGLTCHAVYHAGQVQLIKVLHG